MRVDPLIWLTLAGLAGAGLLAVLHPAQHLDPDDPVAQAGRHVRFAVVVTEARSGNDHWRGTGIPSNDAGLALGKPLDWVWFRPPTERALPGDRLDGRALVERNGDRASLLLDGAHAATVTPGPHPVAVPWRELLADPAGHSGRTLVLNGHLHDGNLHAPDGTGTCPLSAPPMTTPREPVARWFVRLEPDPHAPAWRCHLEGPAP